MTVSRFRRCALAAVATCLLAACGGSQSTFEPSGTPRGPSAVGAFARSLLYVSFNTGVEIYTYPSDKPLGSLGVFGYVCSDKFGNIVVAGAAGTSQVWVYPHGSGQPIAHMYNPGNSGGCSVDPSSENIAVANPFSGSGGSVVVWPYTHKHQWRLDRTYTDPNLFGSSYCTYDPQGNLFLDGYTTKRSFILVELLKGSSTFTTITLDRVVHNPGSMQWYGNDLAIEDAGKTTGSRAVIYLFAINGSSGHIVRATKLKDSVSRGQFLILAHSVIGTASQNSVRGLGFWPYPKGGALRRIISTYGEPFGEALSPK